ncbi:MAG: PD-(D/E)XK nuclease family protein [Candidatus Hodarchaeota archaeon]
MSDENIENLIEKFLLDKDFEILEEKLNKFNLFTVLNVSNKEYVISSNLRWLLDPKETHGLGDYFLKKLLTKVILLNKNHRYYNKDVFSVINIDTMSFNDALVQTEEVFLGRGRGDISITEEENKIYILIENKIYAKEGKDQTITYVKAVNELYPDNKFHKLFIFLQLEGEGAEAKEFLSFTYSHLVEILKETLENKKDDMALGPRFLMEQLIRNVEENLLEEGEIQELCEKLYRKHRVAIEMIYQAKPSNRQFYEYLGKEACSRLGDEWGYRARGSYCAVFKNVWSELLNSRGSFPIVHYEYMYLPENLNIFIHVESWADEILNEKLRENLKNTKITEIKKIKIHDTGSIYNDRVKSNIDIENIEKVLEQGIDKMIDLINKTFKFIDDAVNKTNIELNK